MGKVYEAISKAEKEGQEFVWPSTGLNGPKSSPQEVDGNRHSEQIDFVSYSLNAPPIAELERTQRERSAASLAAQSMVRPAREATLDLSRIDPHLVSPSDFDPRAEEQYNNLAVSLIAGAAERPLKRILIASAHHGDGRTSVTLNMAAALARSKKRVLVLDSDLQRPSVLRLLGVEADAGMPDVLSGRLNVGEAALKILPHGFVVLPTRERVDNSAELFASPDCREVLQLLDSHYDFILFDSPPLLKSADASLLVRLIDSAILVICPGKTSSAQMAKAIAPLSQEIIFGVVLNRTRQ